MATIGLVIRPGIADALKTARTIITWAKKKNHNLLVEQRSSPLLGLPVTSVTSDELIEKADPIVSLGGDGTLIGIARYVNETSPLLVGVNYGNLGFLTEITPKEVLSALDDAVKGKLKSEERSMLVAEVFRDGRKIFSTQAVNDAVVQKGARDRLLEIDIGINGEDIVRLRADGLILGTPTGSTAYSLAAGGSIVHPGLDALLLTPICAHSLTVRPFVLPATSIIEAVVPAYDGKVYLNADGQVWQEIRPQDLVRISQSKYRVRIARSPSQGYFSILRTKLNWGIANRSGR